MQIHTQIPLYLFRFESVWICCFYAKKKKTQPMLISSDRLCILYILCVVWAAAISYVCFVFANQSLNHLFVAHNTNRSIQTKSKRYTHTHSAFSTTDGGARLENSSFASAITPSFSYLSVFVRQTYQKVDYESFSATAFLRCISFCALPKRGKEIHHI